MKTVMITGATSGIGYAVTKALAAQGARVIGVGRTKEHADAARAAIKELLPQADIVFFYGDLAQQSEVNALAAQAADYLQTHCGGRLDVLINNAGGVRNWYTTTEQGYELQFALNHLAGFLLTSRLLPFLEKSGGRVILTGSNSHKHTRMNWDDIMYKRHYSCLMAYKQSKLCNMLFAMEFNRRLKDRGVSAYVVDPGLVNTDIGMKQTNGIVSRFWAWRKRYGAAAEVPAQTYAFLCNQVPRPAGLYYRLCSERSCGKRVNDPQGAARLFALSEKLCGIEFCGGGL